MITRDQASLCKFSLHVTCQICVRRIKMFILKIKGLKRSQSSSACQMQKSLSPNKCAAGTNSVQRRAAKPRAKYKVKSMTSSTGAPQIRQTDATDGNFSERGHDRRRENYALKIDAARPALCKTNNCELKMPCALKHNL